MSSNLDAPAERIGAILIEPPVVFANQLLQMVRELRKALGRDVKPVWMPPQRYGVALMTARLPERARDEVVSMGLRAGVACLGRGREFELRIDPPSLERQPDGSMLILSSAWSASPEFPELFAAVRAGLESTGVEVVSGLDDPGGLRFVFGWIPGPCDVPAIRPEGLSTLPGATRIGALVSGILEPVGTTPMSSWRRLRIVRLDEGACF